MDHSAPHRRGRGHAAPLPACPDGRGWQHERAVSVTYDRKQPLGFYAGSNDSGLS